MVFPVVKYGCKSWTIRKLNTEELMLLNCAAGGDSCESLRQQADQTSQSSEYSLEGLILKLKLEYFGYLM